MVEDDLACHAVQRDGIGRIGEFWLLVGDFEDPLGPGYCGLDLVVEVAQLAQRGGELA